MESTFVSACATPTNVTIRSKVMLGFQVSLSTSRHAILGRGLLRICFHLEPWTHIWENVDLDA